MKQPAIFFALLFPCYAVQAQQYKRNKVCGTDTITVNGYDLKMGRPFQYRGFECTKASALGIRVEFGYNQCNYNGNTKQWLGVYEGGILGLHLALLKWNAGVRFKLGTATPRTQVLAGGDTIDGRASFNPIKVDYTLGYSIDLKHNFSIEPCMGITKNTFHVVNAKELGKTYRLPTIYSLYTGLTLNKYFKLKDFQFLSLYLSYGQGFTNFKKLNTGLGKGYSEWAVGIAYKVFANLKFQEKIK
jgi:hypothetical protein